LCVPFSASRQSLQTAFVSIHWKSSFARNNICITFSQAFNLRLEVRDSFSLQFRLGYPLMIFILFLTQFRWKKVCHDCSILLFRCPTENYDSRSVGCT
jgi:hypothetical protein